VVALPSPQLFEKHHGEFRVVAIAVEEIHEQRLQVIDVRLGEGVAEPLEPRRCVCELVRLGFEAVHLAGSHPDELQEM
jgi:hypothetical protein